MTETFCRTSRYLQPENGARIDAIRDAIETDDAGSPLYPILLTSLIEAADRVDSTTGVQMAYLKQWAPRAHQRLTLRVPELLAGTGTALRGDAVDGLRDARRRSTSRTSIRRTTSTATSRTTTCGRRSSRGTHPSTTASRASASMRRDDTTKSAFNRQARDARRAAERASSEVRRRAAGPVLQRRELDRARRAARRLRDPGAVAALAFDSRRYVGAQIGVHNPAGERVGEVSHLRNLEYLVVCGEREQVERVTAPHDDARFDGLVH